jgi:CBS domain-containing protein
MQVKDIMTAGVECVSPDDTLQDAARKMKLLDVGPMPVCSDDRVVGMLTDRDITIRGTAEGLDPKSARVRDAMTEDVIYCFEDEDVKDATKLMEDRLVRRILVMNRDNRLVGIVALGDVALGAKKKEVGDVLREVSEPSEPRRGAGPAPG